MSESAKHISDLQVWGYFHPEEAADAEDVSEEDAIDLDGAIAEDLELALQNSLSLRLHPSLRRAHWRRLGTEEYQLQKDHRKSQRATRNQRTRLRRKHRSKLVKSLVDKLQSKSGGSRQEALQALIPEAKQKKRG